MSETKQPASPEVSNALRCPLCGRSDAMRLNFGDWVCDRCNCCHDTVVVVSWNQGFEAGRKHVILTPEPPKDQPNA